MNNKELLSRKNKYFYVYIFRDLDGNPIYVGKGSGGRVRDHYSPSRTTRLSRKIQKLKRENPPVSLWPQIIQAIDESHAFWLEEVLVEMFGRVDIGTGTLYNLSNGGDGSGTGRVVRQESINRIVAFHTGRKRTEAQKKAMSEIRKGIPRDKEGARKTGDALRGRKRPADVVERAAAGQRGKKRVRIQCPHCGKWGSRSGMHRYHFDKCKFNPQLKLECSPESFPLLKPEEPPVQS